MKSSLRKLRGFALQRHEQRVDRDRGRGHSTAAAAEDELLTAAQVRGFYLFLSLCGCASRDGIGRVNRWGVRRSCDEGAAAGRAWLSRQHA